MSLAALLAKDIYNFGELVRSNKETTKYITYGLTFKHYGSDFKHFIKFYFFN